MKQGPSLVGVWMMLASLPAAFLSTGLAVFLFLGGFVVNGFIVGADWRERHDAYRARQNQPREVHHYHRITIDRDGNPVEVTKYEERH